MDNELPAEVVEEITLKAEDYANRFINGRTQREVWEVVFKAHETCATEYATKLHQAEQEIAHLKRWKMEAVELLTPIHAYVHKNMEVGPGQFGVKLVLDQCKKYDALQAKFERYEELLEWSLCYAKECETKHGITGVNLIAAINESLSGEGEKEAENA